MHSIFINENDIKQIGKIIPNIITDKMILELRGNLDKERYIKSHDGENFHNEENFNNANFINKSFAFSVEGLLNHKFTRMVDKINFKTREKLRIGQINNINLNLAFDKELRRILPYYVAYNIPKKYKNSKICSSGKVYFSFENNLEINQNIFLQSDYEILSHDENKNCLVLDKEFENLKIIGFSINGDDPISLKLEKNIYLKIFIFIKYIIILLIIFLIIKFFFIKKKNFYEILILFGISATSSLLFIYLKDHNLLFGLRYFRGGADGLLNSARAQEIVFNLANLDFINTLKGGSEIYYYMPGLRYFGAFSNLIFGDTSYGYILIAILLPIFLFKLITNLTNKKIAYFSILSFLFFPVFENIGFGHFNYIHQVVRNHSETLAITLIIFILSIFSDKDFYKKSNYTKVFLYSFILATVTFVRPNFFPFVCIFTFYLLYIFYDNKKLSYLILIIFGFMFNFTSLAHNYYFGNSLTIFTQSNIHFMFNSAFLEINNKTFDFQFIINQFLKWNPLYNIHRLIMLLFIIYGVLKLHSPIFIKILFLSCIAQHGVLLLTHPDSRYAYLAWLLTMLLFIYFIYIYFLNKKNI
ncbi:hypothetical protein N8761_02495 [Alphaproteobacteria bacterium]|nr:hypothetical protein [Alphaproteobacteria bacterium]